MIQISKTKVVIPVSTWNELKSDEYFKELIDVLEDSLKYSKKIFCVGLKFSDT